ncbi:hypothetical protein ACFSHT_15665 [Paraburkholderia silviterrae]|uniref:Uncharacterized protein n=1 Tax=Paraburkholderia silviterrae TaxID=2528715 RepID=A0A4R5M9H7_9BURK|nr:hypothetical protein [Paraburkholderia silviterrae]TDG23269.1 hypothetical protein EYW47_15165 [Paraburkholderia silviterrae]
MQIDLFGDFEPAAAPATVDERTQVIERHAAAVEALPEKLRPTCVVASPVPVTKPELDAWTRTTQRVYLLYLVGATHSMTYRDSSIANVRYVLLKLNGLGGEW